MEINHLLKDVVNLNEYITATQDVTNKYMNFKVSMNIATVLTLKKIRSLEIEYFNKCDENGVACVIFERLLVIPPSKVWGVLAKELVYLLQYWLEAIRKHLINHSTRWWMFLKLILKLIKEIRLKDSTIPNMLVELTAECLLDLATVPKPDVFQRHEILYCLNVVCAESGREIRFAMRTKFGDYFVKLAAHMATSGYLPCQYSSLECLLRWLVPRQERSLRAAAADKWLPGDLCPQAARNLFLNSSWMNFFQDARGFLNALNEGNGLVKSMICRRLCIGEIVIINGTERQQSWLDFNTTGRSISVLLEPRGLEALGVANPSACETLYVDQEITETALLRRESLGLTISLNTLRAPYILPTDFSIGDERRLSIVLSSRTDLQALDLAMRNTFGEKYQLLMDLDTDVSQSPQRSYNRNKTEINSEEDTRFSHPVEVKRRKHSGYIVRTKHTGGTISPSTASTSSLVQLKDRLAALPRYKFDKEPVSVCAQPALSNVSELTEQDDRSIYTGTTLKYQPYGVCRKSFRPITEQNTENKSRSEGDTVKQKSRGGRRLLSPVVSDDNSTSLLLVATIGSANESVINETIERLSKSKDFQDDNIVNLLVQEAMQAKPKSREVSDSGINTDEKKSQEESEAIDVTPNEVKEFRNRVPLRKNCTIISKSTTDDESNTEAINDTPAFINTRKNIRSNKPKPVDAEKQTYYVKSVEEFFSQHISENVNCEIVISPTLAKRINETSSETSENFDDQYLLINDDVNTDVEQAIFNDIEVIDCLNDMVDKVCSDFDKCTEYLSEKTRAQDKDESKNKNSKTPKSKPLTIERPRRSIKLKYKPVKKAKACVTKKTKNIEKENVKKMSTIIEQKEEEVLEELDPINENVVTIKSPVKNLETPGNKHVTPDNKDTETQIRRRKRKLYSPKDDDIDKDIQEFTIDKTSDDVPLTEIKTFKNTKTRSTYYKELEKERKEYTRVRSRKSRTRVLEMPSPRTLKMNSMFDNLKQTVESTEKITLVDKSADVYNFTSESEDDDFKKKKEIKSHVNTTDSIHGSAKVKKGRNTRRVKETDSSYEEPTKTKTVKRKKVTKRNNKRNTEAKVPFVDLVGDKLDLVDERMRNAVREELNTSILVEKHANMGPIEIEPALIERPRMEEIDDSVSNDTLASKNAKKAPISRLHSESNDTKISKNIIKEPLYDSASNDTLTSKKKTNRRNKKAEVDIQEKKTNDTFASKKTQKRVNKKTELLQIKKEKGLANKDKTGTVESDKDDDGTMSPLPGLVVESMPKQKEENNDSLTTNMLQKFKRIYQDGPDVINDSVYTQNMLSDVERFNHSAQNCMSITDEIYFKNDKENIEKDTHKKGKKSVLPKVTKSLKKVIQNKDNKVIEKINIPDTNQLDKSIASDGINAHGDLDEAPPNPETIKEELQPRELQDLDQTLRDYFTKLTREIHNSTSKGEVEEYREVEKNKSAMSPVVSVKRLSFEDISKWMPSRRTSDTDTSQISKITSPKINEQTLTQMELNTTNDTTPKSKAKNTKTQKTSTPELTQSPIVSVKRISLEEFNKWLPMPPSFETDNNTTIDKKRGDVKLVYRTRSKSKITQEVPSKQVFKNTVERSKVVNTDSDSDVDSKEIRNIYKSTKSKDARIKNMPTTTLKDLKIVIDTIEKHTKTSNIDFENKTRDTKAINKVSDESPANKSTSKSKTTISSIKLNNSNSNIENSSDDECVRKIRSMFSKITKPLKNIQNSVEIRSTRSLKRKSTSPLLSEPKKRHKEVNTPMSSEPKRNESGKIKVLEDVIISESGPSVSSINEWLRRTRSNQRDNASMTYKDAIQNVMEKLDTTLVENNQNTSKKFVNLFVEAQRNLYELKDEQRKLYKKVASNLISEMVKVMDEEFAELDRKSQEMSTSFMDKLKQQAFELVREDCKQKRAMVVLLKEDVQAVMDNIERSRTADSK